MDCRRFIHLAIVSIIENKTIFLVHFSNASYVILGSAMLKIYCIKSLHLSFFTVFMFDFSGIVRHYSYHSVGLYLQAS